MRVHPIGNPHDPHVLFELLDDTDQPVEVISGFMHYLHARGYSPNSLSAYCYDLLRFMSFLQEQHLSYQEFAPPDALRFLEYLSRYPSQKPVQRLGLVLSTTTPEGNSTTRLAPATVNRTFAAVSSFYEYLILSGRLAEHENPIQQVDDPALARVSERHRPFMGRSSRQRPIRRTVHVKTVQPVPRPMDADQISRLLTSLRLKRDRAMLLLMLHGGLRPGEVLNLQMDDISYARRRVVIRYRNEHPKGVRAKSRTERIVDRREHETLQAVSDYVMQERPTNTTSPYVFLVGGRGQRREEPLGYDALVKLFARHCEQLGIRNPWVTPHALRHTHATRMWEGGMRELALQKRLGHASPESTRIYTRVADPIVVEEYCRALGREASE